MELKPINDRVVVKLLEEEEKTESGLVLPDTAKEKPLVGEVLFVGDGAWDEDGEKRIPMDLKVGDRVYLPQFGGSEIKWDGEEVKILRESEVLAKVV